MVAAIATYEDTKASKEAIKKFRKGEIPILITVQMAYEGMDAPRVSHIACLTNIRSTPWIEQMLARAVRNYADKEKAYIFCPDDSLMNEVLSAIKIEQQEAAEGDWDETRTEREGTKEGGDEPVNIIPFSSGMTAARRSMLDSDDSLTPGQQRHIERFGTLKHVDVAAIVAFVKSIGGTIPEDHGDTLKMDGLTKSEREDCLRGGIQSRCSQIDSEKNKTWGTTNAECKRHFHGTSRDIMDEADLRKVWAWLNRRWPKVVSELRRLTS